MNYSRINDLPFVEPIQGMRVRSVSLTNVMMTFMEFDPDTDLPVHSHEHEQISVVLQGEVEFNVAGQVRTLSAGEVCTIPANVEHGASILGQGAVVYDCWHPVRQDYVVAADDCP